MTDADDDFAADRVSAGPSADLEPLLRAVARGDRVAFRALYDATSAKLFGIALRICRDRDKAQDVLQDAYVKVWQNAGRYDPQGGRPITWLAAILRNTAIDQIRRGRVLTAELAAEEGVLEAVADPAPGLLGHADRSTLRACLGALEDVQRDCVVLAYCEGYSREELAVRYDRPEATIKTWLRRGLMRLKDCMDRE
ncbi:sigma-70 family RNA polymerase sigma factor [Pannonibacter tanglangensis]|uniref:sigma-70 family RNA polymerase sigma factor n=1 Tax=Pannonibacter tanglangensis TaxID=2750084 RepID=UPI00329A5080